MPKFHKLFWLAACVLACIETTCRSQEVQDSFVTLTSWSLETLSGCNASVKPIDRCLECWNSVQHPRAGSFSLGGWTQLGYHSRGLGEPALATRFNQRPGQVQLQQAWLFAEKKVCGRNGLQLGGRIDYLYGSDASQLQSISTGVSANGSAWDSSWQHGSYGHALPQVYGELAYGAFDLKIGRFFTILGYEVAAAPDNFFYSHSWQFRSVNPLAHTGVLASYDVTDGLTAYAGYTLGWDSGFADNGDAFLGGLGWQLTDAFSLTYTTSAGRLNTASGAVGGAVPVPNFVSERGHVQSLTTRYRVTDRFAFISQKDFVATRLQDGRLFRSSNGFTNYFFYQFAERFTGGLRFEYWRVGGDGFTATGKTADVYSITLGLNCRPSSFFTIRPEVRWDWGLQRDAMQNLQLNEDGARAQTTFGIDAIILL